MSVTPGEELRMFLVALYPRSRPSVAESMDYHLAADGEFADLVYWGQINYLVRRLVYTARAFERRFPVRAFGPGRYLQELRRYLRSYTRYNDRTVNQLMTLLTRCVDAREEEISSTQRRTIENRARQTNLGCHICGIDFDFTRVDQYRLFTIDHVWPSALGGSSNDDNLRAACSRCNNDDLGSYIDAPDFHYEEMSYIADTYEDYLQERPRICDVAVFAAAGSCCAVCGQPASGIGRLYVARRDSADIWHFLNLTAYCAQHRP